MNIRENNGFNRLKKFILENKLEKYRLVYANRVLRCRFIEMQHCDNGLQSNELGYEEYFKIKFFNIYKNEYFYLSYHNLPNEMYYGDIKIFDLNDELENYMACLPQFDDFEKVVLVKDIYNFAPGLNGQIIYKLDDLNYLVKFKNEPDFYKIPALYLSKLI